MDCTPHEADKVCPLMSHRAWFDGDADLVRELTPCIGGRCQFFVKVHIHPHTIKECCSHALNIGHSEDSVRFVK